jgi:amino acid transporter
VSRTTFAMARDHHLPDKLAVVHPRFKVPHHAELAVGIVVAVLAATVDVLGAIGFSSFGVLVYYAVANACAWTLTPAEGGGQPYLGTPQHDDHPARGHRKPAAKANDAIIGATGHTPKLYRTPGGLSNDAVHSAAAQLGLA